MGYIEYNQKMKKMIRKDKIKNYEGTYKLRIQKHFSHNLYGKPASTWRDDISLLIDEKTAKEIIKLVMKKVR